MRGLDSNPIRGGAETKRQWMVGPGIFPLLVFHPIPHEKGWTRVHPFGK
jgi:hypothetical protein